MIAFTAVASLISRRVAFLFAFLAAMITTAFVFNSLTTATDAYWMLPMMGFAQLALFAGYSIYFPELFPTRLRGTGVGFCYNTVRAWPRPRRFCWRTPAASCHSGRLRSRCALSTWSASSRCCGLQRRRASPCLIRLEPAFSPRRHQQNADTDT